jgi:hypothetical protein
LQDIDSPALLEEFTLLFMAISSVMLTNQKDQISWKWARDGCYSVASIYECQFFGAMIQFLAGSIWKATTEPKCRFFDWLVMHDRILTADNMIKRHWTCDHLCSLYLCMHETSKHLLTQCNYTEAVWNLLAAILQLPNYTTLNRVRGPKNWMAVMSRTGSKQVKRNNLGELLTFWWMIWKERNRRIF